MLCALGCCLTESCAYPWCWWFHKTIPLVNGIHSAMANMECCSVITDLTPHHDTPSNDSISQLYGAMGHRINPSWWTHWKKYFSFQPVLHDWCNKGHGMCCPVCGMVHIKEPLLLIRKNSLSHYLSGALPYVWHHITVNKMCWVGH